MSRQTRRANDFVTMSAEHFAKHPDKPVPIPPAGCEVRRINDDGSITYVSEEAKGAGATFLHAKVRARLDGKVCNVWRDYYDQYGYKHTIPEPDGDV